MVAAKTIPFPCWAGNLSRGKYALLNSGFSEFFRRLLNSSPRHGTPRKIRSTRARRPTKFKRKRQSARRLCSMNPPTFFCLTIISADKIPFWELTYPHPRQCKPRINDPPSPTPTREGPEDLQWF